MTLFAIRNLHILTMAPLDLDLAAGECLAVTGDSGSGKSLFLRALADLDANPGELFLRGQPSTSYPPWEWRRQVSLLPAESSWWLARVGDHFPGPEVDLHQRLAEVGLPADILKTPPHGLSSGERQRLSLLRVLLNTPTVLLLDEPTANLDEKNIALVERILKRYQQLHESALIWVTHDLAQARRVATRHLRLRPDAGHELKEL